jgi:hypothetical protein
MQAPIPEALYVVSDLLRIATVVGWGVVAYLARDVYREFRELKNDVHGKGGINERVARLEGASED